MVACKHQPGAAHVVDAATGLELEGPQSALARTPTAEIQRVVEVVYIERPVIPGPWNQRAQPVHERERTEIALAAGCPSSTPQQCDGLRWAEPAARNQRVFIV